MAELQMDEEDDIIRAKFTAETNTSVVHDQHETAHTHLHTHTVNLRLQRGDLQGTSTLLREHSQKFCAD